MRDAAPKNIFDVPRRQVEMNGPRTAYSDKFANHVDALRAVLVQYDPWDAAVSIAVSELWPGNVACGAKHVLAWSILAGLQPSESPVKKVETYEDFHAISEALIKACPDMPMLEDFVPSNDWGEVRIRLKDEFVPMFYGSSIERTPDFVEAFRISRASNSQAMVDMEAAIAVQAYLLRRVPTVAEAALGDTGPGHIEVASKSFWESCRAALLSASVDLAPVRASASTGLETELGTFRAPLTFDSFGNASMQGQALPFLGIKLGERWIPVNARNAPGRVMDFWAARDGSRRVDVPTHLRLARFVHERFRSVMPGPVRLWAGGRDFSCVVSCVVNPGDRIWLLLASAHGQLEEVEREAQAFLTEVAKGSDWGFIRVDGARSFTANENGERPAVSDLRVVLVPTLSSTGLASLKRPARPAQLLPLADLVSILDSVNDIEELDKFWRFVEEQGSALSFMSTGPADMFAAFRDTHGVLVDGANKPTYISLDPSWGTDWRYKVLKEFWQSAPKRFPPSLSAWSVDRNLNQVIELKSRNAATFASSVQLRDCTFQVLMRVDLLYGEQANRTLHLFVQLIADCSQRCRDLLDALPIFQRAHVVLTCELDPESLANSSAPRDEVHASDRIISSAESLTGSPLTVRLRINTAVVQEKLIDATTAAFEVESLAAVLQAVHGVCGLDQPTDAITQIRSRGDLPARFRLDVVREDVDSLEYVEPVIPTLTEYKLARRQLAVSMRELGFVPDRYELKDAKAKIDPARERLGHHINALISELNPRDLVRRCIEQHDALLLSERQRVMRAKRSLVHEVDYDRLASVADARRDFGGIARHYRYLLEKVLSASPAERSGDQEVTDDALRLLIGFIDWYMVLAGASDVLHNEVDVGGINIDDTFIPEVFYSKDKDNREEAFERFNASAKLGIGVNASDAVNGDLAKHLESESLRSAFIEDLGFELKHLLQSLTILAKPVAFEIADEAALSYSASSDVLCEALLRNVEDLTEASCLAIIQFLTLSPPGIRRLPGRAVDECDVPYWEHAKRLHRYTIRPLVRDGELLRWGADAASSALRLWMNPALEGYLPSDFPWPNINREVRAVKKGIEDALELRAKEIFQRHTPFVMHGIDFFKRFRSEGFADVGDFDVFAYWPESNVIITVECKYNRPPFCVKDSRRLRDTIFGASPTDREGQISRVTARRAFLQEHRARLLELLRWPAATVPAGEDLDIYVSRDLHYWMFDPPYSLPTQFLRVDALQDWLDRRGLPEANSAEVE